MSAAKCKLAGAERSIVFDAITEACSYKRWKLYALHVRSTHVHAVVQTGAPPSLVLGAFKAYSSRALNERLGFRAKRWSRHGSIRWLWSPTEVDDTIDYAVRQQGEPMAVYECTERWKGVL